MATPKHTYTEAVGRRKTASARVRIMPAKAVSITVNGVDMTEYFPLTSQRKMINSPLDVLGAVW